VYRHHFEENTKARKESRMLNQAELDAALEAAKRAGQEIMRHYASFARIEHAPADIATEADRQGQEIILAHLQKLYPQDAYCAEEPTASLAQAAHTGPRLWIIDPIDGTRGFAKKTGEFSIMVAFVDQGAIAVGVVAEPAKDRLTYGVRGGGCWRKDAGAAPVRCQVSGTAELTRSALVQSRSRDPGVPTGQVAALRPARVIETYSAGVKLALVARGEADLYVNRYREFHDWDIAAGQVLVEEAGGVVTGLKGETLVYGTEGAWQRHGLLASNGRLHQAAIRGLEQA
jgi:3'(2'), 5'-bisphosphate nucleotidase